MAEKNEYEHEYEKTCQEDLREALTGGDAVERRNPGYRWDDNDWSTSPRPSSSSVHNASSRVFLNMNALDNFNVDSFRRLTGEGNQV